MNKSIQNDKKCIFCDSIFSNKWNLLRHINDSCSTKKNMILNKNNLIEERKQFEDKIKEFNDKLNDSIDI